MRLYVPLNREEYEALERLAFAERRRPQDQAAVLLAQVLEGNPPKQPGDTRYDTDVAGAAEALLAMLRGAPQPNARIPDPGSREDPGTSESTAADSA